MTTDDLIKLCEPLVGRRFEGTNDNFPSVFQGQFWRDAAAALATENERLQREVGRLKFICGEDQFGKAERS